MNVDETVVRNLNYLCKTYDGATKLIVSTKNRIAALNPDAIADHQEEVKALESFKGKLTRKIEKELEFWPVWTEWLKDLPGVGPFIGGNLVLLYYYRFTPVCPCGTALVKKQVEKDGKEFNTFWCESCKKSMKGDGVTQHKVEEKDFPNISGWWHYCGRHVIEGKMPKRKKGEVVDWSSRGRMIGYQFADQINRQAETHLYKRFMLERKAKREKTHPEASKGHRHNMAKHETVKLFLAHFWTVARTLDGKTVSAPYAETILGHTGIIEPYYFDRQALAA